MPYPSARCTALSSPSLEQCIARHPHACGSKRMCKTLQARLIEVEGCGCPAIVVIAVNVQYLKEAVSARSTSTQG